MGKTYNYKGFKVEEIECPQPHRNFLDENEALKFAQ